MLAHGLFADVETSGDGFARQTLRDEKQHIALSLRETVGHGVLCLSLSLIADVVFATVPGSRRIRLPSESAVNFAARGAYVNEIADLLPQRSLTIR